MSARQTSRQVRPFGHALCEALNLQHVTRIEFSAGPNPIGELTVTFAVFDKTAQAIVETIKRFELVERVDPAPVEPAAQDCSRLVDELLAAAEAALQSRRAAKSCPTAAVPPVVPPPASTATLNRSMAEDLKRVVHLLETLVELRIG